MVGIAYATPEASHSWVAGPGVRSLPQRRDVASNGSHESPRRLPTERCVLPRAAAQNPPTPRATAESYQGGARARAQSEEALVSSVDRLVGSEQAQQCGVTTRSLRIHAAGLH